MTRYYGHATAAERQRIDYLEATGVSGSAEERLELALLNVEPAHEIRGALEVLRSLLSRDTSDYRARFWLAYCCVYELGSEPALEEAIGLCDEILQSAAPDRLKAGALMLKAAAFRDLGREDPLEELRQSISLAPDWVSNRQELAQVMLERGEHAMARAQLERALAAPSVSTGGLSVADALFEELVTARVGLAVRNGIREQLSKLVES
jgi:tetratricopeptide (TPR) repeat protein